MLLIRANSMRSLLRAWIRPGNSDLLGLRLDILLGLETIHLMSLTVLLIETMMLSVSSSVHLRKRLVVGVHLLLLLVPITLALHGRADGGVIIAGIQVVRESILAVALSAVANVEEAASSDAEANDDEG